jgi:hypothetical protein
MKKHVKCLSGSQVKEEEPAWSRRQYETEDFSNSTGHITTGVITGNTSFFLKKKTFKSENVMQQEITYFVRSEQCKILNKIFALDLCLMFICK